MALATGLVAVSFLGVAENAQETSNTFHIFNPSAGGPPDIAELTTLSTQLKTQFDTTYRAVGATDWTWSEIRCKSVALPGTTDIPGIVALSVNEAGTRSTSGTHIPVGVCACLGIRTPAASRRFRGHLLLPPAWTASSVTGDGLNQSDAYWTNAGLFAAELLKGTPTGSGWTGSSLSHYHIVIYSRAAAAQSLPYTAEVNGIVVRPKASFLRRRERGSV